MNTFVFLIPALLLSQIFVYAEDLPQVTIKLDKSSYNPYSRVNILVSAPSENVDRKNPDVVHVDIQTVGSILTNYRLREMGPDTGNFTGYITLSGPNGETDGEGPFDGKMKADRGYRLLVSLTSRLGQSFEASATIDYHMAKIFFTRNMYVEGDWVEAMLVDEDLNIDPEKRENILVHLTSSFMRGLTFFGMDEVGVNSGTFVGGVLASSTGPHYALSLRQDGEALVSFYKDVTLPKPSPFFQKGENQTDNTEGVWVFAIVPFLGTSPSPSIISAPLFLGNFSDVTSTGKFNFVVKTESIVQNLKFLTHKKSVEFVNIANKMGTIEMQIPRTAFRDIASVSVNHTNMDFTSNKNATHFNIKINYPEGASKIEIFDLDAESLIVFRDPGLVDQQGNELTDIGVGSQVLIQSQITNSQTKKQPFAYIVQIKDEDGVTVSLSWLTGELPAQDSFRAAQSWIPEESGNYTIETFLWNNLETPSPLAPSKNMEVQIIA